MPENHERGARIRVTEHGPLRVKGPITLEDPDGNAYEITRKTIFLCRCGASKNKPFCDGSHSAVGFAAGERRPEPEEEAA